MIPYPSPPTAYVSTPWLDEATGISWLWASRGPDINGVPQGKWGRAPTSGTLTQAYTSSPTPPLNTALPWLDTTDQSWNTYDAAQNVWVMASGASGIDGADGATLPPAMVTITAADHTLVAANSLAYLRFTSTATKRLLIPSLGTTITAGDIITVRNAGATGDITIEPVALSTATLNFTIGAEVVAPKTTAQLIYLGSDNWDIL